MVKSGVLEVNWSIDWSVFGKTAKSVNAHSVGVV